MRESFSQIGSCYRMFIDLTVVGTICHRQVSGNKVVDGVQRTVVFIYKQTYPGQSLFLRGGINQAVRKECTRELLNCTIPVKVTHTRYFTQFG